jgi:SWIM zinc finger
MNKTYTIASRTDPEKTYQVTLDENGFDIDCTCPHYTFRHSPCYHIQKAQKVFDVERKQQMRLDKSNKV